MDSDLERAALESKDRDTLVAIATAMGQKPPSRSRKAAIIDLILELAGSGGESDSSGDATSADSGAAESDSSSASSSADSADDSSDDGDDQTGASAGDNDDEGSSSSGDRSANRRSGGRRERGRSPRSAADDSDDQDSTSGDETNSSSGGNERGGRRRTRNSGDRDNNRGGNDRGDTNRGGNDRGGNDRDANNRDANNDRNEERGGRQRGGNDRNDRDRNDDGGQPEAGNRRRRRRGRDRGGMDEQFTGEPVAAEGLLDLRDEGYGFLRVNGYTPSKEDVYVSVKLVRNNGLRRGDTVKGTSRPAGRNEKNPSMHSVDEINGGDAEAAKARPNFDDLTPLFPDEKLKLERLTDPRNMTAKIVDLISPIGKGQRGLIVSPPKAGKTTVMKTIAQSIEANNPEVTLFMLLIDERPEEVTDMRRSIKGEVAASTFDRPTEEHIALAELIIERAKRLVEMGQDVVIILDGITRLARAYNLAAPSSGRAMSGGIDTGALYPPKKFFGAARNLEEGGSLTILATALVETGSKMDDVIFEEFKGTGNMELRLDRRLAEKRVYPAIDVAASSTRHEELLFDKGDLDNVWKLRRVLAGLGAEGGAGASLDMLMERMSTFRDNAEFLKEIGKAQG